MATKATELAQLASVITSGAIDNTSVGVTTPAAIGGTTGSFTGDLTIADKIVHSGDTNTAIRFPAADTVSVETSGLERLRVTSAGNVGIGTISPAAPLDVNNTSGDGTAATFRGATSVFQGITIQNNIASSTVTGRVFFDARNELGNAIADHTYGMFPDGSSDISWSTQSAGTRADRRGVRMLLDPVGRLRVYNQPTCTVSMAGGWRTLTSGQNYGISDGNFITNQGGFYHGGNINGFAVVHVPVTGWYKVDQTLYVAGGSTDRRLLIASNQVDGISFFHSPYTSDGTGFVSRMVYLNGGDYLNYRMDIGNGTYFFANSHTMVSITLVS